VVLLAFVLNPLAKRRRQREQEETGTMVSATPSITTAASDTQAVKGMRMEPGRTTDTCPADTETSGPPGEPAGIGLVVPREE